MTIGLGDAQLVRVIARFPLRNPRVLELHEASVRNENFVVEDDDGRYMLRRYRRNPGTSRVDCQLKFQQHLLEHGFPTSRIFLTTDGEPFALEEDTPWALFGWVEGNEYDFDRQQQASEAGRRLSEFHNVIANFNEPEIVVDYDPPLPRFWIDFDEHTRVLEGIFAGRMDDELAYALELRTRLFAEWPLIRLERIPWGWTHGDYHGRNMLFQGDRMVGLFDFDPALRAPLVWDVSRGMFMFGREARGSSRLRDEYVGAFLEGYSSQRSFQEDENQAIPMLLLFYYLPEAPWMRYWLDAEGEDPYEPLKRNVRFLQDFRSELARLAPNFGWNVWW